MLYYKQAKLMLHRKCQSSKSGITIYTGTWYSHVLCILLIQDKLIHLGKMPEVGGQFARVSRFCQPCLHVKSCFAYVV